jgi:hypothetical protein
MNTRKALAGLLALAGSTLAASNAAADVALPVPEIAQTQSLWCWAAVAQSVLHYYQQTSIAQCDIVNWLEQANGWANSPQGAAAQPYPDYCCDFPMNCNFPEDNPGVSMLLGRFDIPGNWYQGTPNNPPRTFAQLVTELDRGNPMIYLLGWNAGGGHIKVISGYSQPGGTPTLELMDPGTGQYELLTYAAMAGGTGYSYSWATLRHTHAVKQGGSNAVLTYRESDSQLMYRFARGDDDFWVNHTWDNEVGTWQWANQSHPSGVTIGGGEAITYLSSMGTRLLSAFARGSDGNVWSRHWNGGSWGWVNLSKPSGVTLGGFINAVAYEEPSVSGGNLFTSPRVQVFGVGGGQLYRTSFNGSTWSSWSSQGATSVCSVPSVVTYRDINSDSRRIYAFYVGCDNHMYVNYSFDTVNWSTTDLGAAPSTMTGLISAIAFHEGFGVGLYAFVLGTNGHLYVKYWNDAVGGGWTWSDQGAPSGVTLTRGSYDNYAVAATTYRENGSQRHHVFVYGTNGHLYDRTWNGSTWSWVDRGTPGSSVIGELHTSSYMEPGATSLSPRIKTFVRGANNHIYANTFNGSTWSWTDQSAPADVQ